ncbi:hypothetical protein [Mycetocola saprophilus]|uniref:hypothetical protein n=1 Tax=Mycetocola saprophilus TaxID=76636 RepID=UPI0012DE311F|nr:hypothetical protein [Mycetocola saprophilus]
MMGIDLTIPGDSAALYTLADWLDPGLNNAVNTLHNGLLNMSIDSLDYWQGEGGDAFRQAAAVIAQGIDPVDNYVADAASAIRAYARRLERGRDKFADWASDALESYLVVAGNSIAPPLAPRQFIAPAGTPTPAYTEVGPNGECLVPMTSEMYQIAIARYRKIETDVEVWHSDLDVWIAEHLGGFIARLEEFKPLADAYAKLQLGNEFVRGFYLDDTQRRWSSYEPIYAEEARIATENYKTFNARARSNNPARRATIKGLSKQDLGIRSSALRAELQKIRVGTKVIPLAGPAIDVVVGFAVVGAGGSISSEAAAFAGGLASGLAAGALISGPAGWVVAVIVSGVAVAGGHLARVAWEGNVPLDVREAIDSGDFGYVFG